MRHLGQGRQIPSAHSRHQVQSPRIRERRERQLGCPLRFVQDFVSKDAPNTGQDEMALRNLSVHYLTMPDPRLNDIVPDRASEVN